MIPNRFSYEYISSKDCVGDEYVLRTNTHTGTTEHVALSHVTDKDSIYVLKTVDQNEEGMGYNRYWEFEPGWDHFDDFLYNGAAHVLRGLDKPRFVTVTVNLGRIKSMNRLSTETYEHSIALHVPVSLRDLDLPGIAGEASTTGPENPVMFNALDILEELYWVMREFAERHTQFQDVLDGNAEYHSMESGDALRAYRALAMAYPLFEGLVAQLTDRVLLKEASFKGRSNLRFKQMDSNTPQTNTKSLITQFKIAHGVIDGYERDFLVETFYNETGGLGIARNNLAHNIFDATRGFQQINWRELARRLIVSIAFLDENVVCTYSPVADAAPLQTFEQWLQEREQEGLESLHNTVPR
jgi:hypothetical protein